MDVLHWLSQNHASSIKGINSAIIPMVLIPLTAVTVVLTSIASIIAGWFGIKLHTEGPKQLLEVLLKKQVLMSMILVNLLGWGLYKTYDYISNHSSWLYTIKYQSGKNAKESMENYPESRTRNHDYIGTLTIPKKPNLEMLWTKKFEQGPFRSGVVTNKTIFYGMDNGYIYEIDKNSGEQKRKFFIGTQVSTRPIIFNQRIYVGEGNHDTHHARIYSFDLKSGQFLKAFTTLGHTEGQPNLGTYHNENLLFITAGKDGLYAINPETMEPKWHNVDGHLDATVTIENGIIYAGTGKEKGSSSDRSYAQAYDFSNGKTLWKKELPLSNWMHPIVSTEDTCYVLGEIYFASDVGLLYCINKLTGAPHFSIPFDAPLAGKPYYIKNGNAEIIYTSDLKGTVCAIDINLKEKRWCQKTGKSTTDYSLSSVEFDSKRGLIWYASYDNGLYAFNPLTGEILFHWIPNKNETVWGETFASVNIDDDFLYTADINGVIRKFKIK